MCFSLTYTTTCQICQFKAVRSALHRRERFTYFCVAFCCNDIMGMWVNSTTKLQYHPKKSMEYCLEMLIFTDLVPLEIVIKKIYIYIYIHIHIYIYLYIGHLFVKHDLALSGVDTRGRKKQRKSGRESKRRPTPPTQRSFHTRETHIHAPDTQAHTDTHTPWLFFVCFVFFFKLRPVETVCTSAAEGILLEEWLVSSAVCA